MAARTDKSRILFLSIPLGLGLVVAAPLPADAQERPRNIMEMLFGAPQQRAQPQPQVRRQQAQPQRQRAQQPRRSNRNQAQQRRPSGAAPAAARAPVAAAVEKAENARDVLVVGDFMAASLARGLTESLSQNRDVRIVARTEGSSGLVRNDYYDWLAQLPAIIEETDPDLVVVMLGSNDRQAIRVNGTSEPVRSDPWTAEYTRRTNALASLVGDEDLRLVWVGMPSFQPNRMTEDMVFLNDLYKRASAGAEGEFIDIWNGFVDASGAFITSGPDPDGQQVRLRNSDGITMTTAGAAKLAYYAEKPIISKLGLSVDDMLVSLAPQQMPEGDLPIVRRSPDSVRTEPVAMNDPGFDGSDALLGASDATAAGGPSPRDRLVLAGTPSMAAPGRADSFNWSGKGPAVSPVTHDNAIVSRGSTTIDALIRGSEGLDEAPSPIVHVPGASQ